MSWSVGAQRVNSASNPLEVVPNPPYEMDTDTAEQVTAAREAAVAIIASGAIGDDDKYFTVSASGHANPGHGARGGWSNDSISLSVYQTAPPENEASK